MGETRAGCRWGDVPICEWDIRHVSKNANVFYTFYTLAKNVLYTFYTLAKNVLYTFYTLAKNVLYVLYVLYGYREHVLRALRVFHPLNGYDMLGVMEEKIIERRIQQSHRSLLLTIPPAIATKAGIRRGQGVRLTVRNGEIVVTPTDVAAGDGAPNPAGPDEYERAVTEMVAKDRFEKAKEHRRGGAASGRSKLERLRLK